MKKNVANHGSLYNKLFCGYAFRHFKDLVKSEDDALADVVYCLSLDNPSDTHSFQRLVDVFNPQFGITDAGVTSLHAFSSPDETPKIEFDFFTKGGPSQ